MWRLMCGLKGLGVTAFVTFSMMTATVLAADAPLAVVNASPSGETAKLEECREIRIQFSEAMVELGRIPDVVQAPYVQIAPALKGAFRWSGTRLLIFTPDPTQKLPFGTQYTVTVEASAASASGRKLDKPYTFTFKTPTVRLLRAEWVRKGGRYDSPVQLALRFNQPVSASAVVAHAALRYAAYEWKPPEFQKEAFQRMAKENPQAFVAFQKKVAQTMQAANAKADVSFKLAPDWDKKRFEPGTDLVVLETNVAPPPQSHLSLVLDASLPGLGGKATPGEPQDYTFQMEPALFGAGFHCAEQCSVEFYNSLDFTSAVGVDGLRGKVSVVDVTDPAKPVPVGIVKPTAVEGEDAEPEDDGGEAGWRASVSFDLLGLKLKPARTYAFVVKGDLQSKDGQQLGYDWFGQVSYWHKSALTSFGTGHGVWEASSGPQLPFYSRNLKSIDQWLAPVAPEGLVPAVLRIDGWALNAEGIPEHQDTKRLPDATPVTRDLKMVPDAMGTFGLDLSKILNGEGKGLAWAGLLGKDPLPQSFQIHTTPSATLVQVTNLGVSVKDSPLNTLVMVTTLDKGAPVEGAEVEIRTIDNKVFWKGPTDRDGIALVPDTDLRTRLKVDSWDWTWVPSFVVVARKGGDTAYVVSDWNEGIRNWDFNVPFNLEEAKPLLRGTVFPDRGVYKLGEEVHFKAILRSDTAKGMLLLPAGTKAEVVLKDSHSSEVDKRTVTLNGWSAADWTVKLPKEGALGNYSVSMTVAGQNRSLYRNFLVAAYRKPDFRVDATVNSADDIAGATLKGTVTARYLFGATMAGRPVKVTFSKEELESVPKAVEDRFDPGTYAFLQEAWLQERSYGEEQVFQKDMTLDGEGVLSLDLPTDPKAGVPLNYTLEGEVTDVSRQTIAGRASMAVHPAPWYLGLKRPGYFVDLKDGLETSVVAATPRGEPAPGVEATLRLVQVQWISVRTAEGEGMYTWDSKREDKEVWTGKATTAAGPVPVKIPVAQGGYYVLRVTASDAKGRSTTTDTDFYCLGPGYTAWRRYDHNRIDLVPEKKNYKPGETARIMIQSPWETATALLTTEREGVRTHKEFQLTSTQQTVTVPITEAEIPNLFVSVLLIKGRTSDTLGKDGSDPGKPAFRLGYCELKVANESKRLAVQVATDKEDYRPLDTATVSVQATDREGKPAQAEVTLWAVDYGVLSLTGYKTPDALDSVWVDKALQVMNEDSRQNIVSRRVITPKGADEGGGGGFDEGAENKARKDFRVLAFWIGSGSTDAKGRFVTQQKLPEAMTTYRVMAVVQDKSSRLGSGQREIRLSKPLLMTAAFPRFLALGDKATFGAVVHSLLPEAGTAVVTMKSLTPSVLDVADGTQSISVPAKGSVEARFDVTTKMTGTADLLMTVKMNGEEDAFEMPLSVRVLVSPEVVAAYGTASPEAQETVVLPKEVLPSVGGLHVETASTALVGLSEGARYLVDYPYGCAEQRASCALALMLTADLGGAFQIPGIKAEDLKGVARATLRELEDYQCDSGGYVYWKGDPCMYASPYLTSYILHVYDRAKTLGYPVNKEVLDRACDFLEQSLNEAAPANEAFMPGYTSWQSYSVRVLARNGRTVDSHVTRLYGYRDRMPVFALCYLWDAMAAAGEKGARPAEILRRIRNAVLPEGGSAHVEELADPYLLWYWNSTVRSTAIALGSVVRNSGDATHVNEMVRWLLAARKNGRWGNTQENAMAMEALVDYYRKYEKEVSDFTAVVTLGLQTLQTETFKGRDTLARIHDTPMADLLKMGTPGESLPLKFKKDGTGTLFYVARLKYASDLMVPNALDSGIAIRRHYEPASGGEAVKSFKAGDLVRVVLDFDLTKERRWVAVTDPIPAGLEPVDSWFNTTARDLAGEQKDEEEQGGWIDWWERGGFDHVERHDDRVLLFGTRLAEGHHTFNYVCRATTAGTFRTAPAHAEEMYEPEVFGRTGTDVIEVKP
jgi:alpha-2-macroglobulin